MAKTQIMIKEERVKKYLQDPTDENFFLAILGILNLNPVKDAQNAYHAFRDFQDAILKRSNPNENHIKALDEAINSKSEQTPSRFNAQNMATEKPQSRLTSGDKADPKVEKPHHKNIVNPGFQI